MSNREVMQQALECIERLNLRGFILADFEDEVYAVIAALKTALEQQEQKTCGTCEALARTVMLDQTSHDTQRKPLTEEDLRKLADKHLFYQPEGYEVSGIYNLARAIEAAHGIKE